MKSIFKKVVTIFLVVFFLVSQTQTAIAAPGDLDATFDPGTGANNFVRASAIQSDGKILIGGDFTSYNSTTRNYIARLNTDGTLDTGFNAGTTLSAGVYSIAIQSDGKVIVGGNFAAKVKRLNSDGSNDATFTPPTINNLVTGVGIQSDGKVVVGGVFTSPKNRILRLGTDGSSDATFNANVGTGFNVHVLALKVKSDDKIVVGGAFTSFISTTRNRLALLNADGSLDTSFNTTTGADTSVWGVDLQSDGKVIISGQFSNYGGSARAGVARINTDGTLDGTFNPGLTATGGYPTSLAIQGDGKVVVGGSFNGGTSGNGIDRLESDGSLDTTFDPGSGFATGGTLFVRTLQIQPDGKIFAGGDFTVYNGTGRNRVVRIDSTPAASLSHTGSFTEAGTNDGSVTGSIVATLTNDTFVSPITLNTHVSVSNVPAGLTAVVTRDSSTQVTVTLTGNATNHAAANNVSNLTITWLDGAFTTNATASNVTNYTKTDGTVTFYDPTTITLTKTNYPRYKMFQRDGSDQYTFTLAGTYTGVCSSVEASFDGGAYSTIDAAPAGGTFSGTLVGDVGQGTLAVRCGNYISASDSSLDIGIGDVYVVAGQSNAEGNGINAQSYTTTGPTATVFPTLFKENGGTSWYVGNDDTDNYGATSDLGSAWPILAGYIMENTGVPVAFITTANGGKPLVNPSTWQKGGAACITAGAPGAGSINCFANMVDQVTYSGVNAVKAVLWFQGETDAIQGRTKAEYNTAFDQFAADVATDLPGAPKVVAAVIGALQPAPTSATNIRAAIMEAWGNNANVLNGPQAYDYDVISDGIGDTLHLNTDAHIRSIGFRWWKALESHFYGGSDGRGPVATSAIKLAGNTKVQITFTDASLPLLPSSGLSTSIWRVKNNGTPVTVTAASVLNDKVTLTLASAAAGTVTVDYAYDNSGEAQNVLTDSNTGNTSSGTSRLPADPFINMAVGANPNASLNYSGSFTEAGTNDGSVTGSIVATLTNDTFVSPITLNTHVSVSNVPAGLTAVVTRDSSTQVTVTLTGNATNHAAANDVSDLTITWLDGAFTTIATASSVTNYIKSDGVVTFDDNASLSHTGSFTEAGTNDGSVTGSIVATLTNDTFVSPITLNTHVSVSNVPAGLTAVVTRDSSTQVTVTLTGNATNHAAANDVSDLTITWLDGAFTTNATASDVAGYVKNDGAVTFTDPDASLNYSGSFTEAGTNDGSVTGSIVATLTNDTFVSPITLNTHVSVSNVPAGLTAVVTRDSSTQVTVTLTGNATNHAAANDVSDLTITWLDGAFTILGTASDVTNYINSSGEVAFDNPVVVSSGSSGSSSGSTASSKYLKSIGITLNSNTNSPSLSSDDSSGEDLCPSDKTLTQNLRSGAYNGRYHWYTKGIVKEANILQAHLNRLGFNSGPEDGMLGPISDGAIKRMQIYLGTFADGYVGPITRGLLNTSCGKKGLLQNSSI